MCESENSEGGKETRTRVRRIRDLSLSEVSLLCLFGEGDLLEGECTDSVSWSSMTKSGMGEGSEKEKRKKGSIGKRRCRVRPLEIPTPLAERMEREGCAALGLGNCSAMFLPPSCLVIFLGIDSVLRGFCRPSCRRRATLRRRFEKWITGRESDRPSVRPLRRCVRSRSSPPHPFQLPSHPECQPTCAHFPLLIS